MVTNLQFVLADYLVFAATVVISVGIGLYYAFGANKQRTPTDYLLAGRKMKFLPLGISLFVSMESSVQMLGLPAEGYTHGIQIVIAYVPLVVMYVVCAYVTVPMLHPLKITSTYQYLELRFDSRAVRLLGSTLGILYELMYIGIVLYGPAVALQAVADFPMWLSIFGLALMAVLYTSIGGMRAVIWTDVFQTFIMIAGLLAVLIMGTIQVGGPASVWHTAQRGGRLNFFNFSPDPRTRHTFWNLLVSYTIFGFATSFKQSTVQRVSSTHSLKDARRVMWVTSPFLSIFSCLAAYGGVVAYAYYVIKECDPLESGNLKSSNQIFPYIVMDIFAHLPGMPGLFVAALFSASLSTLSTSLSNLSAFLLADFVQPLVGDLTEWKATLVAKISVAVWGCVACLFAWLISMVGGTLSQISVTFLASMAAPLTGLFLLASLFPRINAKGAVFGGVIGFAMFCWLTSGMNFTPGIHKDFSLAPAPTTKCEDVKESTYNGTDRWYVNMTALSYVITSQTTGFPHTEPPTTESPDSFEEVSPEGIQHLYTISYTFVGPIALVTTIVCAHIVCFITGANKPGQVDPRYLLHWSDFVLVCLPASLEARFRVRREISVYYVDDNCARRQDQSACPDMDVVS